MMRKLTDERFSGMSRNLVLCFDCFDRDSGALQARSVRWSDCRHSHTQVPDIGPLRVVASGNKKGAGVATRALEIDQNELSVTVVVVRDAPAIPLPPIA